MPLKGKGGHGKGKKSAKPKAVLQSLSSDDKHDDHDEHHDATPNVPITSTPTTPQESPVEPPSKKSKKMRQLTAEEEDDMAEWLKDNPCIYNKKLDLYRQTDMKKRLWIEKTQEFPNIDVEYLMSSYKSMRTHFGKLSRLPTGSGAQDMTQMDEGILCKFGWLKTHISRQTGKQLGGITEKLCTAAGPSTSGKKIALHPMCVILRVVRLRCNLLLHLLLHLLPSPSQSPKSSDLIAL